MRKMKVHFLDYHPIILLLFFVFVIGVPMFCQHPVLLAFGIFAALSYACVFQGLKRTILFFFKFTFPVMALVILIHPMFSHYGVTILFYLKNGNPVTLESIVYGIVIAVVLGVVITWLSCFWHVMTSEKIIYLCGKLIPPLSLMLSICLQFVPRFAQHFQEIRNGQRGLRGHIRRGNLLQRISYGLKLMSIMVTWSLEEGIRMADSMKARGYGLKGRTTFSIIKFDFYDGGMLAWMLVLAGCFFVGEERGMVSAIYNPLIQIAGISLTMKSIIIYGAYLLFCFLPIFVEVHNRNEK